MSNVRKAKHGWVLTLIFSLISIAYIMPIVIVLMNSFKRKIFISNRPFALPDACLLYTSLVIADQNAAVNTFPGLVHTARHTMGVGNARSR